MALGAGTGSAIGAGMGAASGNMGSWVGVGVGVGVAIGLAIGAVIVSSEEVLTTAKSRQSKGFSVCSQCSHLSGGMEVELLSIFRISCAPVRTLTVASQSGLDTEFWKEPQLQDEPDSDEKQNCQIVHTLY